MAGVVSSDWRLCRVNGEIRADASTHVPFTKEFQLSVMRDTSLLFAPATPTFEKSMYRPRFVFKCCLFCSSTNHVTKCFKVLSARTVSSAGLEHLRSLASLVTISHRNISTTVPLQTKKRKQSKYQPRVPPFHFYGATHRLLRGASVTGERYGPIFDRPDYTYLDGRPTPLTPEQMKEKVERKDQAERVMRSLREMEEVKNYCAQKKRAVEHHKEKLTEQRLKAKS